MQELKEALSEESAEIGAQLSEVIDSQEDIEG